VAHGRRIAVIGLGYVGLPVAVAFARSGVPVVGFDIDHHRVEQLLAGCDRTREVEPQDLRQPTLSYHSDPARLAGCDFFIVTVPTPVDAARRPDLKAMLAASQTVGGVLAPGAIVVYESTVYPGAVEEDCVPALEAASRLRAGRDFTVGYSPERINPGDKQHRFETITKVVAAQDARTLDVVAAVYGSVVIAGIHRAPSIKVAEAAKVIENTQRDLNIAFMNELSAICQVLGIDTLDVLDAAKTKWNFLPFHPGLVGGHCIGVDPYYLTHKAEMIGYHPQVILAGRRINDGMAKFVAEKTVKSMIAAGFHVKGSKVNVIGLTFKENCPDLRNSKVADIVYELQSYGVDVHVYDPVAAADEAQHEYGIELKSWEALPRADAVIAAVAHKELLGRPLADIQSKLNAGGCFIDVKSQFDAKAISAAGFSVWRL
jgi:UDP-N-acetyl-D-galactosamine dehydrogenase